MGVYPQRPERITVERAKSERSPVDKSHDMANELKVESNKLGQAVSHV